MNEHSQKSTWWKELNNCNTFLFSISLTSLTIPGSKKKYTIIIGSSKEKYFVEFWILVLKFFYVIDKIQNSLLFHYIKRQSRT